MIIARLECTAAPAPLKNSEVFSDDRQASAKAAYIVLDKGRGHRSATNAG